MDGVEAKITILQNNLRVINAKIQNYDLQEDHRRQIDNLLDRDKQELERMKTIHPEYFV